MRTLKIATAIMVLLVLAGYYYFNYYTNQNNALDDFAYGNGRIEATEVNVATKISGRVEKVLVKEGDIVEKDKPLPCLIQKSLKQNWQWQMHKSTKPKRIKITHSL